MDFGLETSIFLAYTAGMFILYILGRIFFVPLRFMLKLFISSLAGGIALIIVRFVGEGFDLILPVNPVNAVITGITGLPGIAGLLIYFNI